MINRKANWELVRTALKRSRVVALLGPRQSGKTTLARQFISTDSLNYFDLEDPQSLARLSEPDTALYAHCYCRTLARGKTWFEDVP
jgi:predicted AAA+ superfamily ATPase